MSLLKLSWLGLWPRAASLWLILLLAMASWLLVHVLVWTYTFYDNCHRLRCFPQPPLRNWFLGHLDLITPTEEGLTEVARVVTTYPQGFKRWMGPIKPVITLCHPDIIRPVVNTSGEWTVSNRGLEYVTILFSDTGQIQNSEEGLQYTQGLASTFGDVCYWWVGPLHAIIHILHPTFIKPVLLAPGRHLLPTACCHPALCFLLAGDGLLLSGSDNWSHHIHMLTPAFQFNILKPYMKILNENTNIMHMSPVNPESLMEPWGERPQMDLIGVLALLGGFGAIALPL